jgi:prefoldin subunit 5
MKKSKELKEEIKRLRSHIKYLCTRIDDLDDELRDTKAEAFDAIIRGQR